MEKLLLNYIVDFTGIETIVLGNYYFGNNCCHVIYYSSEDAKYMNFEEKISINIWDVLAFVNKDVEIVSEEEPFTKELREASDETFKRIAKNESSFKSRL